LALETPTTVRTATRASAARTLKKVLDTPQCNVRVSFAGRTGPVHVTGAA
jgi:hypothetical protein